MFFSRKNRVINYQKKEIIFINLNRSYYYRLSHAFRVGKKNVNGLLSSWLDNIALMVVDLEKKNQFDKSHIDFLILWKK